MSIVCCRIYMDSGKIYEHPPKDMLEKAVKRLIKKRSLRFSASRRRGAEKGEETKKRLVRVIFKVLNSLGRFKLAQGRNDKLWRVIFKPCVIHYIINNAFPLSKPI